MGSKIHIKRVTFHEALRLLVEKLKSRRLVDFSKGILSCSFVEVEVDFKRGLIVGKAEVRKVGRTGVILFGFDRLLGEWKKRLKEIRRLMEKKYETVALSQLADTLEFVGRKLAEILRVRARAIEILKVLSVFGINPKRIENVFEIRDRMQRRLSPVFKKDIRALVNPLLTDLDYALSNFRVKTEKCRFTAKVLKTKRIGNHTQVTLSVFLYLPREKHQLVFTESIPAIIVAKKAVKKPTKKAFAKPGVRKPIMTIAMLSIVILSLIYIGGTYILLITGYLTTPTQTIIWTLFYVILVLIIFLSAMFAKSRKTT